MSILPDPDVFSEIRKIAFACQRCNDCCREKEPGSNIVLVSPGEVRAIMTITGLSFDEVAEPYPDTIREGDCEYTLGWALIREEGKCRFLRENACSVYDNRPWICRTYPFMLDGKKLIISPCTGIRKAELIDRDDTDKIIQCLVDRQSAEEEEDKRIATVLSQVQIPPGRRVVVDGEGLKVING